MSEDFSKMKKVTFSDGLPRGTVATFTHDDVLWFAYPQKKAAAMLLATDRAVGALSGVRDDLLRAINSHPAEAAWLVLILARANKVLELTREKIEAQTMRVDPTKEGSE